MNNIDLDLVVVNIFKVSFNELNNDVLKVLFLNIIDFLFLIIEKVKFIIIMFLIDEWLEVFFEIIRYYLNWLNLKEVNKLFFYRYN